MFRLLMRPFQNNKYISSCGHNMFGLMIYVLLVFLVYFVYHIAVGDRAYQIIPIVGKRRGEWSSRPAQLRYLRSARQLVAEGLEKV